MSDSSRSAGGSLRWIRRRLRGPAASRLRTLAVPAAEGFDVVEPGTVHIDLPDLSEYPTPIAKGAFLLRTTAGIKHALLVQYLYAAYSLRRPQDSASLDERRALDRWSGIVREIAREEMGHLFTVENLLLFLRQPVHFERGDLGTSGSLYPFSLRREPLTRRSLAKYIVAESPTDARGIEDIVDLATQQAQMMPNRVGVLYALLGVVFTASGDLETNAASGEPWAALVRDIGRLAFLEEPGPERWHLPDEALDTGSLPRQATDAPWAHAPEVRVWPVGDRPAALAALRDIAIRGEGPAGASEAPLGSHFQRFLAIYRGTDAEPAFPDGEWQPTYAVPIDPRLDGPPDDVNVLRTPEARNLAMLADLRYGLLIGYLAQYFVTPVSNRHFLGGWCLEEMRLLRTLSDRLTHLPRSAEPGAVAALPFTVPTPQHLPADPPSQWALHVARLQDAIALVQHLVGSGEEPDPDLAAVLEGDKQKLVIALSALQGQLPTLGPTRWECVRQILNTATDTGLPFHDGKSRFWNAPVPDLLTQSIYGLRVIAPPGPERGRRSNLIKSLKGEPPFGPSGYPRMPKDRPPVPDADIAFIEAWIDDDCPEG
jgi:hypothetical protein